VSRWPGFDGGILIALDLMAIGLWWWKGLSGMGAPVALLCALTALWLILTARMRRATDDGGWSWR
jgi:hypothetical protein